MPFVNKPRPIYKDSPLEHKKRMERQRARRAVDKKFPDKNGNGEADAREGKDVSHKKALDKGVQTRMDILFKMQKRTAHLKEIPSTT